MRIEESLKLDYEDVLIRPKRSEAPSRKTVQLIRPFECLHGGALTCLPIIAANMHATGTIAMAQSFKNHQAMVALHKYHDLETLGSFFCTYPTNVFITVGVRDHTYHDLQNVDWRPRTPLICLDAANGYSMHFVKQLQEMREAFSNSVIMAGNVATPEMVQELLLMGADIVKVGIGPGSACTTRLVTGVGYPQLSAVIECADAAHGLGGLICADGGCKWPGDVAKAFAAGADFVMIGGMLAGCDECTDPNVFFGMASEEAQEMFRGGVADYCAPEGKSLRVVNKGPANDVLKEITGGLRSACAYVGAARLKDLPKCTTFIRVGRVK
jgi:GMP reductase